MKPKCWIIKTTEGGSRARNHWIDFKNESVIAVGWGIRYNPKEYNNIKEFRTVVKKHYNWNTDHAIRTIYSFAHDIRPKDIAIICRGYTSNQKSPIIIYGIAKIGKFRFDLKSNWWRFKRKADILKMEVEINRKQMSDIFKIDTCLRTIHGPFNIEMFNNFCRILKINLQSNAYNQSKINVNRKLKNANGSFLDELDPNDSLPEGGKIRAVVNSHERNPKARLACLKYYGDKCCICGFRFADFYGTIGKGVIQVHHLIPFYISKRKRLINPIKDLRPICANCHIIIHKNRPPLGIQELKEIINRK